MEFKDWYNSEPSKYWQPDKSKHVEQDIISNPEKYKDYLATYKMDGNWSRVIVDEDGKVTIQSRTISKVTGQYGDLTEKVPHIVEWFRNNIPPKSIILGELCYKELSKHSDEVGSILRCLPAKAVARQKDNPLTFYAFDILYIANEDLHEQPYEERIKLLPCYFDRLDESFTSIPDFIWYSKPKEIVDIVDEYHEYLDKGGEGYVLQKKDRAYYPGSRTSWASIKLKQATDELELKVINTINPNQYYEGTEIESWEYWDKDGNAITKRFAMGWKNGVIVDYNGTQVKVTSGCSDEDAEWLASNAAKEQIKNGQLYAVVRAMQVTKDGSLRHPALIRLREDL